MIENDDQWKITKEHIEKFKECIVDVDEIPSPNAIDRGMLFALNAQLDDLNKQVQEYEKTRFLHTCPLCDSMLIRATRTIKRKYKNVEYTIDQPGEWCDECGEGFFHGEDFKATREKLDKIKREIDER